MEPNSSQEGASNSSKPLCMNEDKCSDNVSFGDKTQLPNVNDNNGNTFVQNETSDDSKLSSQRVKNNDDYNPEPSTSSKKTEMEKLLDELTSGEPASSKKETESTESKENHTNMHARSIFSYFEGPNYVHGQAGKKTYQNSEEYFADLRQWLQQAYFWQSVTAAFPYFMMCQQFGQITSDPNSSSSSLLPTTGQSFTPQFPFPFPVQRQEPQPAPRPDIIDGVECRIPSFWKRIAAEFIDFLILFFVKIAVTYIAVNFFNFVEMESFDIFQKDVKLAYKTFIQITHDIVILEMIHRLVVCAFETFWLIGGQNGRIGGSTPGKNIMGLRVLLCDSSTTLREGDDRVIVRPGTNLGIGTAFLRALTKNFVLALLIPTSFAFIFFPHNRTGYDMICNTIVVEEPVVPHRVHQD